MDLAKQIAACLAFGMIAFAVSLLLLAGVSNSDDHGDAAEIDRGDR